MTFPGFAELWARGGLPALLALFPAPVLISLEPWARLPGPRRTQFNTQSPQADSAQELTDTASGVGGVNAGETALPLHSALGERLAAQEVELQLVRKTDRNVYAHVAVGRSNNNDIPLDQPSVSRFHADLRNIDGVWQVRDARSRNGTKVNGVSVVGSPGKVLAPADVITFGEASCVFCPITEAALSQVLGPRPEA